MKGSHCSRISKAYFDSHLDFHICLQIPILMIFLIPIASSEAAAGSCHGSRWWEASKPSLEQHHQHRHHCDAIQHPHWVANLSGFPISIHPHYEDPFLEQHFASFRCSVTYPHCKCSWIPCIYSIF